MSAITTEEKQALVEFRNVISDVLTAPYDDDEVLVKWLRARRCNVKASEEMFRKSMKWRKVHNIDKLVTNEYKQPEVMEKYYPGGVCGCDKEGRPVFIDCFTKCDMRGIMASLSRDDILEALFYRMEMTLVRLKEETNRQGKLVNQVVQILDMDNFGRKQLWLPGAELIADVVRTIENNYPEMLFRTYIINAPRLFHFGFNFIKSFLSEDTRKKFVFLGGNWKQELLKVTDADQLPVHFGGTKTDPDGDEFCKSLIGAGGEVPEEYYREENNAENDKQLTKVHLKKGCVHKVPVPVTTALTIIKWYVKSDRDLGFGINFTKPESTEETVISPVTNIHCSRIAHLDTIVCEEVGTYTFLFDNQGSWWHERYVEYCVDVATAEQEIQRLEDRDLATKL